MRKGLLSDAKIIEVCPEYQPIPMKAVKEVLQVKKGTNDFTGIKQIYRIVPPRPVNISALATSLSQMGKNRAIPISVVYPSVVEAIIEDVRPLASFERTSGDLQALSAYESRMLRGGMAVEEEGIGEGIFGLTEVPGLEPTRVSFDVMTREPREPVEDIEPREFVGKVKEIGRGGVRRGAGAYSTPEKIEGIKFGKSPREIRQAEITREERVREMGLRGELLEPLRTRYFGRKGGYIRGMEIETPTGVLSGFPSSQASSRATREGTPEL